jgi:hypothetical protein
MLIPTDLLKAALLCASTEETRYYLKGVHLSTSGHMVTTDGHRMFVARLNDKPAADVIIPLADVQAALKLAGSRAQEIEVTPDRIGQIAYTPVDGTFPIGAASCQRARKRRQRTSPRIARRMCTSTTPISATWPRWARR